MPRAFETSAAPARREHGTELMKKQKPSFTRMQKLLVALLFLAPVVLMLGKTSALPISPVLWQRLSFADIPAHMTHRVEYLLCVPLGAVLVVFFRLTLGIRIMGPFRSILIAFAFQAAGIVPGLVFLAAILGTTVALRPAVRRLRLAYFGRVSIMLSAICTGMILALLLCDWLGLKSLQGVAYFPIVVICLMAEGFATTLSREGYRSALWRGGMTALVAVLIALASSSNEARTLFLRYPELLLVDIGAIIVIGRYLDLRLLKAINPKVQKPKQRRKAKSALKAEKIKVPSDLRSVPAAASAQSWNESPEQTGIS
jgi:hypothetical protein